MLAERSQKGQETAVLFSGGLDSGVLLAEEAQRALVLPVYVAAGLAWEEQEWAMITRLFASPRFAGRIQPPVRLELPMGDVYPATHWAIRGTPPGHDTPDEDVYLIGRNIVLLSKVAVLCALRKIARIAVGPLAGNPFPDATPEFFAAMERALSLGLAAPLTISSPLSGLHKEDVIRLGVALGVPLELTLSCMNARAGRHCGACSKCRERRDGFRDAGLPDPTPYDAARPA